MRPNDADTTRNLPPTEDPYDRPSPASPPANFGRVPAPGTVKRARYARTSRAPASPKPDPYVRPDASPYGDAPAPDASPEAYGALRVRVTTARGALPVCGATVLVSPCGSGGVCAACATDDSGLSRLFRLPTESVEGAKPGEAPPCARYDVEVLAAGFEPATFVSVPVYAGVTSVQCAELIPHAADGVLRGDAGREGRRGNG